MIRSLLASLFLCTAFNSGVVLAGDAGSDPGATPATARVLPTAAPKAPILSPEKPEGFVRSVPGNPFAAVQNPFSGLDVARWLAEVEVMGSDGKFHPAPSPFPPGGK